METVISGNENLLGTIATSVSEISSYKKTAFLLTRRCDDGFLACNTLTGEMVLLTAEEIHILDTVASVEDVRKLEELCCHALVVPVGLDEVKRTEQLRAIIYRQRESTKIINHYNILPTTNCNARCFYCYESDVRHINMTRDVADRLVSFISRHRGDSDVVHLSWFGGEPTLGLRWIDYLCSSLDRLGIPFTSDMVSNGYLFDEVLVRHAKRDWNLTGIQITLDGTEHIYNDVKSYVGVSDNPFFRVIRNIELLLDAGIRVDVRLNVDEHNVEDVLDLVGDLEDRFAGREKLIVYARLLKEGVGFTPVVHTDEDVVPLRKKYINLRKRLENDGWPQNRLDSLPHLRAFHCMADNPGIVQVTPDGKFGKCEDAIFRHTVGSLRDGITDMREVERWRQLDYYEECATCPLLPSCAHLIAHCPSRSKRCWKDEKEEMLHRIGLLMQSEYEEWKHQHK